MRDIIFYEPILHHQNILPQIMWSNLILSYFILFFITITSYHAIIFFSTIFILIFIFIFIFFIYIRTLILKMKATIIIMIIIIIIIISLLIKSSIIHFKANQIVFFYLCRIFPCKYSTCSFKKSKLFTIIYFMMGCLFKLKAIMQNSW